MTRQRCALLLAVAMMMAAGYTISGCGSSSSTSSTQVVQAAKTQVTLAAKFPSADGAVKSMLPTGTQSIEVYAMALPSVGGSPSLIATLTAASPTATIKMGPGLYMMYATAFDSTDPMSRMVLAETTTGGEIVAGIPNTVNLTFLNGQWTLTPAVVISDGSQLNDIVVGGGQYQPYLAKAGFDFSKPFASGSGSLRYRFSNNSSARTSGGMLAQFVGASNNIAIMGSSYNLTQKCSNQSYMQEFTSCEPTGGDHIVMIDGQPAGGPAPANTSESFYQGDLLVGNADNLLPSQGQTTFT